jgi:hypothetical protein
LAEYRDHFALKNRASCPGAPHLDPVVQLPVDDAEPDLQQVAQLLQEAIARVLRQPIANRMEQRRPRGSLLPFLLARLGAGAITVERHFAGPEN